jgi:hypothetical protein
MFPADPTVTGQLLDRHQPDILALVAGARPLLRPVHHHTWETFSLNWQVDVRMAFHWVREALLLPLRPGSRVLVMSSGAAVHGSPMSGGYAGAKATLRFLAAYAARAGTSEERFLARMGPPVTPQIAGDAFGTLAAVDGDGGAYELTGGGLRELTTASR